MIKWIVLNYDLGLKGDYESLYRYLDNKKAMDCGNCNAVFKINVSTDNFEDIVLFLKEEISNAVSISSTDRIYITASTSEVYSKTNYIQGRFLFGSRKRAVWEGYGDNDNVTTDPF